MSELQQKPQSNIGAVINWVAATSLKPNHENAVLVRCREFGDTEYRYVYMTAQYVKHCKQWFVMSHNEEFQYDIVVSHWAEIPEPPCLQHLAKRNKCNTNMTKLTVIHTIRFSEKQAESLQKLKDYDVNVSQFIRIAIAKKIKSDWKQIKEKKERVKLPF